jgi:enhancing lycopene biosynthesis protein 2
MSKKIGVVLSGCGFMDGAEIHESVCALLALDRAGAEIICCAPDVPFDVVDHRTGEPTGQQRNVLAESARIARGQIRNVSDVTANELDGLILPGGFGAAKNLSDFASRGAEATVLPDVTRLVRDCMDQGKPVGAICIAPAVVAVAAGDRQPLLTIGNDAGTAAALQACGARHEDQPVDGITVDAEHKVVTTPAYMLGPSIAHVARGIDALVARVLEMA